MVGQRLSVFFLPSPFVVVLIAFPFPGPEVLLFLGYPDCVGVVSPFWIDSHCLYLPSLLFLVRYYSFGTGLGLLQL